MAGRRKQSRIDDVSHRLRAAGAQVDITPTSGPGHATVLARAAAKEDLDCLIAAGGDGTISETATGLLEAVEGGVPSNALPPLGILPMGTANVMAHDLGLVTPFGIARRKITKMFLNGTVQPLHLGQVERENERRAFVMMVGAGYDGLVVAGIDLGFKKRFGKLAYVVSGTKAFLAGAPANVRLRLSDEEDGVAAQWIIITNGQHYAGGYMLSRRTSLFRSDLAAIAVTGATRFTLARALLQLGRGKLDGSPGTKVLMGRDFTLESLDDDLSVAEVDGDYFGRLPVRVSLAAKAIPFLTPKFPKF